MYLLLIYTNYAYNKFTKREIKDMNTLAQVFNNDALSLNFSIKNNIMSQIEGFIHIVEEIMDPNKCICICKDNLHKNQAIQDKQFLLKTVKSDILDYLKELQKQKDFFRFDWDNLNVFCKLANAIIMINSFSNKNIYKNRQERLEYNISYNQRIVYATDTLSMFIWINSNIDKISGQQEFNIRLNSNTSEKTENGSLVLDLYNLVPYVALIINPEALSANLGKKYDENECPFHLSSK